MGGGSEQLFHGDGEIAYALARCVENGIGDRRRRSHNADLSHRLAAERAGVEVRLPDGDDLDVGNVGIHRQQIFGKIVVDDARIAPVDDDCLEQRLTKAHDHTASPLAFGELGIVDASAVEGADHAADADGAEVFVDSDFDELRAPGVNREWQPGRRATMQSQRADRGSPFFRINLAMRRPIGRDFDLIAANRLQEGSDRQRTTVMLGRADQAVSNDEIIWPERLER